MKSNLWIFFLFLAWISAVSCTTTTAYIPPVLEGLPPIKNLEVRIEGQPEFEVFDKRFDFNWYDMFLPFSMGIAIDYAREQDTIDSISPNNLLSPKDAFSNQLVQSIIAENRLQSVHLADGSKNVAQKSSDALLILELKEWGLLGSKQQSEALIPYLSIGLCMTGSQGGRTLWQEQFRLKSMHRRRVDDYAHKKELLGQDLADMAAMTGKRIALLITGKGVSPLPQGDLLAASLNATSPVTPSTPSSRGQKGGRNMNRHVQGENLLNSIPDGELLPDDIRRLFSNSIIRGKHNKKRFEFWCYFQQNGTLVRKKLNKGKKSGRWTANSKGLCIAYDGAKLKCAVLVKENGAINQYATKSSGKRVANITYTDIVRGSKSKFRDMAR